MKRNKLLSAIYPALILFGLSAAHAWADTIAITGTRYEAVPAAALGGRCDPVPTLTINNTVGTATGTSNFGNFVPDMTACLHTPFPAAITDGVFVWTFADGDTLTGTWSGLDTRITIPTGHLLTINETYSVTGGSGAFLDATGSIAESGSANSTGTSAIANYTFSGTLTGPNLTATPEPGSLSLVSAGLLASVGMFRRRWANRNATSE